MKRIYAGLSFFVAGQCMASGSPWLLNPGATSLNIAYVNQYADRFWLGSDQAPVPGGDIEQDTVWLSIDRGLTDNLALDLRTGFARSDQASAPGDDGRTDSYLGLTWRFHDEFLSDSGLPSAALRVGGILKGNYDTGTISAIGDGASGVEASLILGKVLTDKLAVSGEFGYRWREDDVPYDLIYKANVFYNLTPALGLSAGYQYIDAESGLDIGGPGFTPDRFPEVEEDQEIISFGATFNVNQELSLGVDVGQVIDGRNAAKSDIASFNIGYTF